MTSIARVAPRPIGSAVAPAGRVLVGILIDLAALAVPVAVAGATAAAGLTQLAAAALIVALAVLGAQLRLWSREGTSLGWRLTGVRQVSSSDSAPLGLTRLLQASWFADVRGARDPVDPRLSSQLAPPVTAPGAGIPVAAPAAQASTSGVIAPPPGVAPRASDPEPAVRYRALLSIDGRIEGALGVGVVLGRNPEPTGGERPISIADLAREVSKTHLAIRPDAEGRVWAIDLNSTNGSVVTHASGATSTIPSGGHAVLAADDVVQIGRHAVAVQLVAS
ncbi:MAG: FHA domain-containing protein [Pseudolysinimonas sp.]|uniref:FHA domain-containing protein n=1 Tax=Pseudolysinimonas sp. TaxID=2680009 RepID=UPI0032659E0C